jgi:hypothetical protein
VAKCSHCKEDVCLDTLEKETKGTVKKEVMYSCPHCHSVLGIAFFVGGLLTGRP